MHEQMDLVDTLALKLVLYLLNCLCGLSPLVPQSNVKNLT